MNIRNISLNKAIVASISTAVLVAIFLCPFSFLDASSAMLNQGHMGSDSTPITHTFHLQEMTTATAGTSLANSLILSLLLLGLVLLLSLHVHDFRSPKPGLFPKHYIRRRDYLYQAKRVIHRWLSLFEGAPNSITAA